MSHCEGLIRVHYHLKLNNGMRQRKLSSSLVRLHCNWERIRQGGWRELVTRSKSVGRNLVEGDMRGGVGTNNVIM